MILSTTLMGFRMGDALEERIRDLYTIKKMLQLFEGEMRYGNALLEEIFLSCGRRLKNPFGSFLTETGALLSKLPGEMLKDIWEQGVRNSLKKSFLTEKDKEELILFGRQLGYLDIEMQQKVLFQYEAVLNLQLQELQKEVAKRRSLYRSLGVLAGLLIVILLF